MRSWQIVLIILYCCLSSCQKEERFVQYAAIAHTRLCDGEPPDHPDARLKDMDLSGFDMRWLMGDMACNSTGKQETIAYLDTLFDLGNPNTLFAVGNHDDDNMSLLASFNKRPSFYTYTHNGIVFIVLDTQLDNCSIKGPQLEMFKAVSDSIRECKHLVILHHKLIWLPGHESLSLRIKELSNAGICEATYCLFENNFYQDLYPTLDRLSRNGIQVVCLAGDIGVRSKAFEWSFNPNFHLLATGWSEMSEEDQFLIFEHDLRKDRLSWQFKSMVSVR